MSRTSPNAARRSFSCVVPSCKGKMTGWLGGEYSLATALHRQYLECRCNRCGAERGEVFEAKDKTSGLYALVDKVTIHDSVFKLVHSFDGFGGSIAPLLEAARADGIPEGAFMQDCINQMMHVARRRNWSQISRARSWGLGDAVQFPCLEQSCNGLQSGTLTGRFGWGTTQYRQFMNCRCSVCELEFGEVFESWDDVRGTHGLSDELNLFDDHTHGVYAFPGIGVPLMELGEVELVGMLEAAVREWRKVRAGAKGLVGDFLML
jgi:hypothetical protein